MFRLRSLSTIVLWLTSALSKNCRCTLGSPCWPSDSEFQTLASRVSQPLIHPVPLATPCYVNSATGSCSDVRARWFDGVWRSDQPGATEHTNQETYTFPNGTIQACYLNTTLGAPCEQGSVPVIGVDARTPKDIQEAVKFAVKHNLRFVIKNTGHDYLGRSSGKGSFVIWTHHMKNITFHTSFSPTDAMNSVAYDNVLTLEAGVQWFEAYDAAKQRNRVIVGGFCGPRGSIGAAGGWIQGGGHSPLSANYGLGVDNVLEISIVTADGDHIISNAYRNKDLFWALRGGGGGTWGVITSVTYKTHPSAPFSGAFLAVNSSNADSTHKLFTEIIRLTPSLVEQGYGGYVIVSPQGIQIAVGSPNATAEQTRATFLPLFEAAHSLPGLSAQNATAVSQYWLDFFLLLTSSTPDVGIPTELSSWLLPKDVVATDKPELLARELLKTSGFVYCLVTGGQVSRVDPKSAGINPVWRKSMAYTVVGTSWREGANSTEIAAARDALLRNARIIQATAPESGGYVNEASRYDVNWKKSFFGTHYDRLRTIKRKYDPESVFLIYEGIASDEWDADLNCRV